MQNFEMIGGLVGIAISLSVIIFRRALSHYRFISIPKGFGGKSFIDQFGKEKGLETMAIFGSVMLLLSLIVFFAGVFGIELPRKMN